MTKSPNVAAEGPVACSVSINGAELPSDADIAGITVTNAVNQIPQARIILKDGDAANCNYPLSDSDTFKPGAEVVIKAGYGGDSKPIFKGVVVRHRLSIDTEQGSRLIIECRDKSFAMTLDRKNLTSANMKDSDVIQSLVENYSGLSAEVAASNVEYGEQVQYYCTDWDYMLMRAEVNGMIATVQDGKVTVAPPAIDKSPVLALSLGVDIINFDADINGSTQLQSVESSAWDMAKQKMENATAPPQTLNDQGSWQGSDLAGAVGASAYRIQTSASVSKAALKEWAESRQLKAGLARIQGKVSFQGSEKARVGSVIEVKGVGKQFEGKVFVSSVVQEIKAGDWITQVDFGMAPEWFVENNTVAAPPAAGWLPAIAGLHVGVVVKLENDPQEQHRVQVQVSALGEEAQPVWARLSTLFASDGFGCFFFPDIGDEVVLGFMNDDPSQPVILGSMYSSNRPPASPPVLKDENDLKSFVTRSKLTMTFDDDNKSISITTPGGNAIYLDEDGGLISITDQNHNSIVMNTDGISLDSQRDINISARGDISISASSDIKVSAMSDVKVEANNIKQSAKTGFTAKGDASAELSAAGQTTVKGAMVMIN